MIKAAVRLFAYDSCLETLLWGSIPSALPHLAKPNLPKSETAPSENLFPCKDSNYRSIFPN